MIIIIIISIMVTRAMIIQISRMIVIDMSILHSDNTDNSNTKNGGGNNKHGDPTFRLQPRKITGTQVCRIPLFSGPLSKAETSRTRFWGATPRVFVVTYQQKLVEQGFWVPSVESKRAIYHRYGTLVVVQPQTCMWRLTPQGLYMEVQSCHTFNMQNQRAQLHIHLLIVNINYMHSQNIKFLETAK